MSAVDFCLYALGALLWVVSFAAGVLAVFLATVLVAFIWALVQEWRGR